MQVSKKNAREEGLLCVGGKGSLQGDRFYLHELWQEKLDFRYGKLFQFTAKIVLDANIVWIAKEIRDSDP